MTRHTYHVQHISSSHQPEAQEQEQIMTDQSVNPFDLISPVDHSVPETGPSSRPIVRTEEGIVTEEAR